MSFANPTPLRIGMKGNFTGKNYRVVGRVVMGMEENGETYYWNEFNLEDDTGECATLVYEETERGGEWRLFIFFEPEYPMSAQDAASKRIGDSFDFGDGPFRVTLVDQSRVYHIEGKAPEGVEVGDVANYFNAESGRKMIVVSWTGEEVEFYRGINIASGTVASAFKVQMNPAQQFSGSESISGLESSGSSFGSGKAVRRFVLLVLFGVVIFSIVGGWNMFRSGKAKSPVKIVSATESPLKVGNSGKLNEKNYTIIGHDLVQIEQVNLRFTRHEYQLRDDDGNTALLVSGSKPGAKDWVLFTPLHPVLPMTQVQAGALRLGDNVNVDGVAADVSELFRSTASAASDSPVSALNAGTTQFGFTGRAGVNLLLVRWSQENIGFYRGIILRQNPVDAFTKH